jgi:ribosomal protein S7
MAKKIKTIKKYQKKKVRIDPIYQSMWFSKFTNKFMLNGKKHIVERNVYNSLCQIQHKFHRNPLNLLFLTLKKIRPAFGFISKRLGKEWKKIPIPIKPRQQFILALKWLVLHTKTESDHKLEARIVRVFTNFFKKKKTSLTKFRRQYQIKIVEERVNTRFRWK